ncbi:MAG: hypothetical protein D6762_05205, partial [Candidatus Neomarinimicrobiota bacterium]
MTAPVLIGIDGGATKISGAGIRRDPRTGQFTFRSEPVEIPLASTDSFSPEFKPVDLQSQLQDLSRGEFHLTEAEIRQGTAFVEATRQVIRSCVPGDSSPPILVGIGLPGLKTADRRGISAMANGPRMPEFCADLERLLRRDSISLLAPIHHLGSDADYCGLGEEYAEEGAFTGWEHAYYLGGGTGAADALKLKGVLLPLDATKDWLAKTWELQSPEGLSMERFASAGGIQAVYA